MSDGAVLVIDAVEGLLGTGALHVRRAIQQGLNVSVVINKIDRLVLELRLPPADCYYKLRSIIDRFGGIFCMPVVKSHFFPSSVNVIIQEEWSLRSAEKCSLLVSPIRGNVLFASCLHGWVFSLQSFAATMYHQSTGLAERLWGDIWHIEVTFEF